MQMRHAAFVVPILLVAVLAAAIILASGAGPQPAAAATVARQAGGDPGAAPPPDPQATLMPCEDGTVVPSPATNPGLVGDCELLLEAKDALRGTETLNWAAGTAIASWEGITVGGSPSRVTELVLDGNNTWRTAGREILLTGAVPAELGGLSKLQRLTLSRNELTGTIPAELGNLSELTQLQLYSNQLTGGIPPELGRLANLATGLDLSRNQLSGGIPVEVGQLSSLRSLRLHNNQLAGSIPASLGDLSNLSQLNLAGNTLLTGCIPESLRGTRLNDLSSLGLQYCTTTTTYTLTTSVEGNGRTSPFAGTYSYLDGASVTVTATPDGGNRVASWGGDCSGTALTCVLTMDADKTASVTFEQGQAYTLTTSAGANGSIDPAPGTHSYSSGVSVTVTATPDSGYRVASWGGDCSGTALTCVLTMDEDETASVTFEADTYTLTTSAGANGSIDPAPGTHTYNDGASVTITAAADSGYRIASWGSDCSGNGANLTCVLTMDAGKTASVTFEQGQAYTLTTSAGANGSIDPAPGTHSYRSGVNVTVTATPESGYRIASWGGDCGGTGTASTCDLTMDANKTASVTFVQTRMLTISAGANGTIAPAAGTYSYLDGASVTVTATPDAGNRIVSWGGDCAARGTALTCVLTMDADKTASVTFEQGQAYTLTTSAGANGSIDPAPGTHSYSSGVSVTVTATPDSGYRVASWGGDCSGTALTCVLTMDEDETASVTFEADTYTLTTSAGANGSIDPAAGMHTYSDGASVTVTATPGSGYRVASWSGDCSGAGTAETCVLTMDANKTASVAFEQGQAYTLTTSAGANGGIDPAPGTHSYSSGVSVTVTATPRSGYRVASWGDDCSGTDATCVLTMDANKTVTVTFATICANDTTVPNHAAKPELVQDCDRLLALRDTLAGTGTLNWSADSAMASWTGVTVGGTPQRVTRLSLANGGLTGQVSGLVGNLTGLTELRLNGNSLTGSIPSKLGQLVDLTHAYLAGNGFTGCVPPSLRTVTNNDIVSLGLSDCAEPTDISFGQHTLTEGTYKFLLGLASPPLIFDVPAGAPLEILGITRAVPIAGFPAPAPGLMLREQNGRSWICLDTALGRECNRWTVAASGSRGARTSSTTSIGTVFNRIAESAWLGNAPDTATSTRDPGSSTRDIDSHLGTGVTNDEEWWHIARNVIIGSSIVVCTEYPNATTAATKMWNDQLRSGPSGGQPYIESMASVFTLPSASSPCPTTSNSMDKIDYVNVYGAFGGDDACGEADPACAYRDEDFLCGVYYGGDRRGRPHVACFLSTPRSGAPLYTYTGKQTVILNISDYPFVNDGYRVSSFAYKRLRHTVAHELGHVLGLHHPLPTYSPGIDCKSASIDNGVMWCFRISGASYPLQLSDFDSYKHLYEPNLVVPLNILVDDPLSPIFEIELPFVEDVDGKPGTIRFNFDATHMGSEHEIQIRAKNDPTAPATWRDPPLKTFTVAHGEVQWEYSGVKSSIGVYGIFSTTHAYTAGQVRDGGPPIGFAREVGIGIPPNPPVTPTPPVIPPPGPIGPLPPPPDVALSALTLSGATFTFSPGTRNYTVTVDDDLSQTTVTATASSRAASVSINPVDANSDTDAHEVNLPPGETIPITATVTNGGSTRIYTVNVIRPDPFAPPIITGFTGSGTQLTGTFTWTGKSHRFVWWELHVLDTSTNTYSVDDSKSQNDSSSPVTFSGDWGSSYKLRGQACEHQDDEDLRSDSSGRSPDNPLVTCGEWSAFSSPVELEVPPGCTLTVTSDPGGTTTKSAVSVACGGAITATATPNTCFTFTGWTGDETSSASSITVTMDRDKSIHANFGPDGTTHTLTVRVVGGGTTTGAGTYPCGTIVTATAAANTGWRFSTWEPASFGTATSTRVRMTRSGWIGAHFERNVVSSGSFTVTGTGNTQSAAAADAADQAAAEATRLGADQHWRTSISYAATPTVTYISAVGVSWELTGTASESAGPLDTKAAAVAAASASANAAVPSGATATGTTVETYYSSYDGWWAQASVSWRQTGTQSALAVGPTAAAAEAAALARASAWIPSGASITGTNYLTEAYETPSYTATAGYSWETYSRSGAAAKSGIGTSDSEGLPAGEPEPE